MDEGRFPPRCVLCFRSGVDVEQRRGRDQPQEPRRPVRLDDHAHQDWPEMKRRARAAVLRRLASMGMPDLEEHIKFEVAYAPRAWRSLYNLERGSAFGLSHNFLQVGYMRPHNRHARYRNLYFVGSSTHPGTGLPMVLLSAQLTAERVLQEQRRPARASTRRTYPSAQPEGTT